MRWVRRLMLALRRTPVPRPDPAKLRVARRLDAVEDRLRRLLPRQDWDRLHQERLEDMR